MIKKTCFIYLLFLFGTITAESKTNNGKTNGFTCSNNAPLSTFNPKRQYTEEQLQKDMLKLHNDYRLKHGSAPLTLNKTLSRNALKWAKTLASTNTFKHQPKNPYGENLFSMLSSNPSAQVTAKEAFCSWYNELKNYDYSKEPKNIMSVGHFTQVVWKRSKQIGVAMAKGKNGKTVIVAEYDPPGNFIGQFRKNVSKPR